MSLSAGVVKGLVVAVAVAVATTAAAPVAAAGCDNGASLRALVGSVAGTFRCERRRLRAPGVSCLAPPAPACAGDLVDGIVTLAGLDGIQSEDRVLGSSFRCQRAITAGVAKAALDRIRGALAGTPGPRLDQRAQKRLYRIDAACSVVVDVGTDGGGVPRAGAPCDAAIPVPGERVDAASLATCVERTIGAALEPVLRRWLKPSIVLILTDDQPASMLWPMDTVRHELADRGVVFGGGVTTTPLCAPSRASILTGRYAHNHGVLDNGLLAGFENFDDSSTIATWLHDAGYRTSLVGKYINGYEQNPFVPPGWDDWHAFVGFFYFNYPLYENGTRHFYGSNENDYLTDVLAAKAVDFIKTSGDQPFFLYFAPFAPHDPATPAPRHVGRFATTPPWRPPSYDEADVSDKPTWVQNLPLLTPDQVLFADQLYEGMLESLLAVDDAVAAILQALADTGRENDTIVVFMSDNGLALGEHRVVGKLCPYEECLRVPFIVRYPRLVTSARGDARPVANIDLASTFAEFAGTTPGHAVDGTSLAGLLDGSATSWRTDMMLEQFSFVPPSWRAVWGQPVKYVEYAHGVFFPGESELYDLPSDPYELTNRQADPAYAATRAALATRLRELDPTWTQTPPP